MLSNPSFSPSSDAKRVSCSLLRAPAKSSFVLRRCRRRGRRESLSSAKCLWLCQSDVPPFLLCQRVSKSSLKCVSRNLERYWVCDNFDVLAPAAAADGGYYYVPGRRHPGNMREASVERERNAIKSTIYSGTNARERIKHMFPRRPPPPRPRPRRSATTPKGSATLTKNASKNVCQPQPQAKWLSICCLVDSDLHILRNRTIKEESGHGSHSPADKAADNDRSFRGQRSKWIERE